MEGIFVLQIRELMMSSKKGLAVFGMGRMGEWLF